MTIFVFGIANLGILLFVVFTLFRHARTIEECPYQQALRDFAAYYCAVFVFGFTLAKLIPLTWKWFCYAYLISIFFIHLPPTLFWRRFLDRYYKDRSLVPVTGNEFERLFLKYPLSKREQGIVRLILRGKSNREIENELFISLKTAKTHVYNIYKKLGVKSRWQLLNFFLNPPNSL